MSDRQSARCSHTPRLTPHCTGSRWRTASLQMRLQQAQANYGPGGRTRPDRLFKPVSRNGRNYLNRKNMAVFYVFIYCFGNHFNNELNTTELHGPIFCSNTACFLCISRCVCSSSLFQPKSLPIAGLRPPSMQISSCIFFFCLSSRHRFGNRAGCWLLMLHGGDQATLSGPFLSLALLIQFTVRLFSPPAEPSSPH